MRFIPASFPIRYEVHTGTTPKDKDKVHTSIIPKGRDEFTLASFSKADTKFIQCHFHEQIQVNTY